VRNEIIAEIEQRAAALSIAKGRFAALVFEWWAAQNYPAVTKADQAMQDLKFLSAAEDKGTYDGGKNARKRAS